MCVCGMRCHVIAYHNHTTNNLNYLFKYICVEIDQIQTAYVLGICMYQFQTKFTRFSLMRAMCPVVTL